MRSEAQVREGLLEPRYLVSVDEREVCLNEHLGRGVTLNYLGELQCRHCEQPARKLYGGGHCYDCFTTLARCDLCVMSPDRCHYHEGTCREPEWGEAFCMQPHSVYLAITSGPKIGITRAGREQRRWLDQGATAALKIISAPSRRAAGAVEAHFARRLNDRTDWRKMVTGTTWDTDLQALARQLERAGLDTIEAANLPAGELDALAWEADPAVTRIRYPVLRHSPARRLDLSEEQAQICDNLTGVIGQYLLFSRGVLNVADYAGHALRISLGPAFGADEIGDSNQLSLFD